MATAVEIVTTLLSLGGLVYMLLALWGARDFDHHWRRAAGGGGLARGGAEDGGTAPDVSILKPLKGVDTRMYAGFASHCAQQYAGRFEMLFGVGSMDDPAVAEIERLRAEFPECAIRLIECPERLGTSGKVSNLIQMLREARYGHILINDSDIRVSPNYLTRVMACFGGGGGVRGGQSQEHVSGAKAHFDFEPSAPGLKSRPILEATRVGMVTAPYRGRAAAEGDGLTLWARLEALGISTDFMPGVLTARKLEDGIRFGLGSTLAVSREALTAAGGLEPLADFLADDYEMGARIARAGYRVELCAETVETTVPAYDFRGFRDHQLRWARSTRDSRRWGYLGLGITYCIPWAVLNCIASGFALWSFTLLSLVLLARVSVALSVGVGLLRDEQVLRDIWLLPLRDFFGLGFWAWSFAANTVVWRGERFTLKAGRLTRVEVKA